MKITEKTPLLWPQGWPRAKFRHSSRFDERTILQALSEAVNQLEKLGADKIAASANTFRGLNTYRAANRDDPGAAVYFTLHKREQVLACDKWSGIADNFWAIAKHLEALRGQERWGVGGLDRAFDGYLAIPLKAGGRAWYDVLGIPEQSGREVIESAYRNRAKECHPDKDGGSHDAMIELKEAYEAALNGVGLIK